jgi:hypothetical protein
VPQLALNDHERDALVSHFDRMSVPLVRRESAAYASCLGGSSQLLSCGGLLPMPTSRRTVDNAQQLSGDRRCPAASNRTDSIAPSSGR